MLSAITININPVALQLGPLSLRWYGIMYVIAFYCGYRFGVLPHLRNTGIGKSTIESGLMWVIIFGLIGARLYYVVQNNAAYYITHPQHIFAVWEGGMAFFGAILLGIPTVVFIAYRWKLQKNLWQLLDACAFFAVIGQPIGRIGNIINGDILGAPSSLPWSTSYTFPSGLGHCAILQPGFVCGVSYQPAAAYEALGTIAIGLILFWLRRHQLKPGMLIMAYVALYAVSQFLIFFLRHSEPVLYFGLKQAQLTAIAVLFIGVPLMFVLWRRFPPAEPSSLPENAVAT
jgi:phosphatidylglycerol:prolipoprotein diacylglycerol transferase